MKLKALVIAATMAATPLTAMAGDIAAGQAKSSACVSCHGADGIGTMPIYPNLAGKDAAYLESALKAYRDGQRTGGTAAMMNGVAAGLSDQDISNLAAYFSSL